MFKYVFIILISVSSFAIKLQDKDFDRLVKNLVKNSKSELMSVEKLSHLLKTQEVIVLDAREKEEFKVSHIKNAIYVGYDDFNLNNTLKKIPKNKKVIVYCSVGYRSGIIADKLKEKGFQTFNLYGGIFEWVNLGNKVYSNSTQVTNNVHTYNKSWSKWLIKGKAQY